MSILLAQLNLQEPFLPDLEELPPGTNEKISFMSSVTSLGNFATLAQF